MDGRNRCFRTPPTLLHARDRAGRFEMSLLDQVFSSKPSRPRFVEIVVRALEKAGLEHVEEIAGEFALKAGDGKSTIFLSNIYANYCSASRKMRPAVLAEFVGGAVSIPSLPSIPSDFASAKPGLMPAIRDAAYFNIVRLMQRKDGKDDPGTEVVTKPLVGGLVVALAYDTERNITSINRESFEKWGVSLDEAFAAAKDNLWEKTDPGQVAGQGGVYWSQWGDSYDSSRMLLTEIIYRLSVDGDPVAFVPSRNELWLTGSNNSSGLAGILRDGMESHFNRGHPLSPDLYVLLDGAWKVWVPEDPSLRDAWMKIKRRRDAIDYAQQQELLNAIHKRENGDIYVASYMIFERKDGLARSACVWTKGVDSSLPRAENISFIVDPEGGDHFVVPWEAAAPIVENLLEEEAEFVPVRYRVREFPNAEQIDKLRRLAL
jgi:hypothetical protein